MNFFGAQATGCSPISDGVKSGAAALRSAKAQHHCALAGHRQSRRRQLRLKTNPRKRRLGRRRLRSRNRRRHQASCRNRKASSRKPPAALLSASPKTDRPGPHPAKRNHGCLHHRQRPENHRRHRRRVPADRRHRAASRSFRGLPRRPIGRRHHRKSMTRHQLTNSKSSQPLNSQFRGSSGAPALNCKGDGARIFLYGRGYPSRASTSNMVSSGAPCFPRRHPKI